MAEREREREDKTSPEALAKHFARCIVLRVLEACEEYFDQRADAEYFTDSASPHPNEEMRLLCQVREALAALKGEPS